MKKLIFISLFTYFVSFSGFAGTLDDVLSNKVLRVGVNLGYIPFEMIDFNGTLMGFDVDLANLLGSELGVKVEFVQTPWQEIIPNLKQEKYDVIISGMSVTTKRALNVTFSQPYMEVGQSIMMNTKSSGICRSYKDVDKEGYEIYVQEGTTGHVLAKRLFSNAQIKPVESIFEAAKACDKQSKGVFIFDEPFVNAYTSRHSSTIKLGGALTTESLAIATKKEDSDFINVINSFIQEIKGDGRLKELQDKYFPTITFPKKSTENKNIDSKLSDWERSEKAMKEKMPKEERFHRGSDAR